LVIEDTDVPEPDTDAPAPPPRRVVCTVDPSVSEVASAGTARLERFGGPVFTEVQLQGTSLVFEAPADALGVGSILLPGFSSAEVFFADGPCVLDALVARAAVYGVVTASEGIDDDRVEVRGCGAYVRTDVDGGFFTEIDAERCTLRATRRDGLFTMRSDPLFLEPRPGEDIQVELVFPPFRAAGVGTALSQWREGIYIREVYEDTPADFAGLEPGDRILALDGEPVADLDVMDFVDLALGPEGSAVRYTVERQGEPLELEMVRELID
jgi:membrane-associated protease RseP (regulator of RpoE activity)